MFQTRFLEIIKTYFIYNKLLFKHPAVYDIMWKNCRTRQATDDNIIRCMHTACLIINTKIQTLAQNIKYVFLSHCNTGYANAPQCYVKRTSPVLLNIKSGGR
jgi:hypothetical protein